MKTFFDTSVLVPAFQEDHVHHQASWRVLDAAEPADSYCGVHSLAEMYSTLTGIPGPRRRSSIEAMIQIESVRQRLSLVALDADGYADALAAAAGHHIAGGAIYDALLAQCALKAGAEVIYTWNVRDFERCGPEVARRLRTPGTA
ncbi:MAG TPA: PIN domain-containing protein [Terriglobales bacterium]|nr:PIN domain-containing protein [Terriglobales bacterium]